jgi:ectoine hydroxylase-related dioxygenase (phytanoyl-CoA dioxygenase family)
MYPVYQAKFDKFFAANNWLWSGDKKTFAVSKPQIMNTVCFSIGPGAHKQPLHRDDRRYHVVAAKVDAYPEDLQRDTGIGWFVAAMNATIENGCTRFIPGSHLWEDERRPDDALVPYAELKRGDAFMMFASCYHGVGANMTNDQERLLFSCLMRGWLRQEENRYVSFTKEETLAVGKDDQKFVGYQLSESFVGWVRVRV